MALTVKKLINNLKKFDQDALVVWQDHDQYPSEINEFVGRVMDCDESLLEARQDDLIAYGKTNIIVIKGA
jgi:hypothetical protein